MLITFRVVNLINPKITLVICNIIFNVLEFLMFLLYLIDVVAEWSKALDLSSSIHWRGLKSIRHQHIADVCILKIGLKIVHTDNISVLRNLLAYVQFYYPRVLFSTPKSVSYFSIRIQ